MYRSFVSITWMKARIVAACAVRSASYCDSAQRATTSGTEDQETGDDAQTTEPYHGQQQAEAVRSPSIGRTVGADHLAEEGQRTTVPPRSSHRTRHIRQRVDQS